MEDLISLNAGNIYPYNNLVKDYEKTAIDDKLIVEHYLITNYDLSLEELKILIKKYEPERLI